jgi:hypothetical protein
VEKDKIAPVSRRPGLVVVVCVALLLATLPGAAWAHPWHTATGGPSASAERGLTGSDPAAPANGPILPHHAAPPPLALAAGALALLALVVVQQRPLALALVLVVAMAGSEGVFHAALHLQHVSHPDGLTIGAAAAPAGLSADTEIPAAPTPILLGPAPEHGGLLGAGIGHASHRGRAPPILAA